jgi:hypothetical protein
VLSFHLSAQRSRFGMKNPQRHDAVTSSGLTSIAPPPGEDGATTQFQLHRPDAASQPYRAECVSDYT